MEMLHLRSCTLIEYSTGSVIVVSAEGLSAYIGMYVFYKIQAPISYGVYLVTWKNRFHSPAIRFTSTTNVY
jgi:hypothetical protein